MSAYTHLHLHTQYSILDGAANIQNLIDKAVKDKMTAIAITDHGNLYGVLEFFTVARKNNIKPIIGCEVYVSPTERHKKEGRNTFHLTLLAKSKKGYHNLCKLVTLGYTEGFYYTPRVDKELLKKYSEGLIALSACLGGEIPKAILKNNHDAARKAVEEYIGIFGDDFYFELMRHGLEDQKTVNTELLKLAAEYNVKVVATNDVHYINREDNEAHHILVCLNTNKDVDDPTAMHYSGEEYFKTTEEMKELFLDIPEAISNIDEVVGKIEDVDIRENVVLPHFPLPEGYENEDDYLADMVKEGALKRYGEPNEKTSERLSYELSVIKKLGFAGYFLIVQDFINEARRMGILVGPGRGSAAGSAVAYVIGITNIDPLKFDLLFERFLNPDRKSMPDMDIDFDDYGTDKVIDYVVNKYGYNRVAKIITFGTMASRTSIRDVGRVLKLPLSETDRLAKLVPEEANITLKKAFDTVPELKKELESGTNLVKKTLNFARILEGSVRHTGTHACGMIIGNNDLFESIPLCKNNDSKYLSTQYEGKIIEIAGMLKMDFLSLKTLTIMKDALDNIKKNKGIDIVIDDIPFDDETTFDLYRNGYCSGTFQFESDGMRSYLRELKPDNLDDLIAMNALYRPGPMQQIHSYIQRKFGHEKVEYPHPCLEEVLKSTYGIFIYQEQIMKAAIVVANFSPAEADDFRKAIGKKQEGVIASIKEKFINGAAGNGIDNKIAGYIYELIEKFANYGFNKSHAAAYSVVAYQTAYLKAHHPANYMAAVLGHNMDNLKKLNGYISECQRMGIEVLGPDINESDNKFTVNKDRVIRFGLGAIKGVGENAVQSIVSEREENGHFTDIFDLIIRVNPRTVNKKCLEALAYSGALDSFSGTHRACYFHLEANEDQHLIDRAMKFGQKVRDMKNNQQTSLFGDNEMDHVSIPVIPVVEPWTQLELLKWEKDFVGYYVSGHPLDEYAVDMKYLTSVSIETITENMSAYLNKTNIIGGLVNEYTERFTKKGTSFGHFSIEDYTATGKFSLFGEKYLKFKHFLSPGTKLLIKVFVTHRFGNPHELMTEIQEISLLSDARKKFFKKINISIDLQRMNEQTRISLENLVKNHPGKCRVFFNFSQTNGNNSLVHLTMTPEKMMINPTNEFFKEMESIPHISFTVN